MSRDRVRSVAVGLVGPAESLAALGAALRFRRDGRVPPPELGRRLDAVLDALAVRDAVQALDEQDSAVLLALVESFVAQALDHVRHPDRIGWERQETDILLAQGHMSAALAPVFKRFVVPALGGGLAARLAAPDASFLDVGTGVGALAIAMCRLWPALRVVGIDPLEPALALARDHVAAAGLADRVELRGIAAETLEDAGEHDLAWVPTFFISARVLERVADRVHAALRPGGCALFGLYARPDDPLGAALADLRTLRHGGAPGTAEEIAAVLTETGFVDVAVLFDLAWGAPIVFVAGRRPAG